MDPGVKHQGGFGGRFLSIFVDYFPLPSPMTVSLSIFRAIFPYFTLKLPIFLHFHLISAFFLSFLSLCFESLKKSVT